MVVVDGVCSVAGEELYSGDWGVDLVLTASQKAVGVPPGLALLVAGPRAIQAFRDRKTPVPNYYADWSNWLPVMQAYEARKTAYFAKFPWPRIASPALDFALPPNERLARVQEKELSSPVWVRSGSPSSFNFR